MRSTLLLALAMLLAGWFASDKVVAFVSFGTSALFESNLHPIVAGRAYRSAAMSHRDLQKHITELHIKHVVDLRRGDDEPEPQDGMNEEQFVNSLGLPYTHVRLNSRRLPPRDRLLQLIDVLKTTETPVLIHCTSGSNRTAIAAAIWLMLRENRSVDEAKDQLDLRFGYIDLIHRYNSWKFGSPTISALLERYRNERFGAERYREADKASPEPFDEWALKNYHVPES